MKYNGTLEDLKQLLRTSGINGEWQEKGLSVQFRSANEGILNFFPTTNNVSFQGKADGKQELEQVLAAPPMAAVRTLPNTYLVTPVEASHTQVFVVYGHDDVAREQLELVLHKLGLNPFVLSNTGGKGLTIIEALEEEIIKKADCKFGIVLLTPDDVGYSKKDGAERAEPRARQNVVLEMGMLISALGRQNVAILKKGHLEIPSDAHGILYLGFNEHVKETVPRLADRLSHSGFVLKPEAITNASS